MNEEVWTPTNQQGITAVDHAYIDEAFPFREHELVEAFALEHPDERARGMAADVVRLVREARAGISAARQTRAHGASAAEAMDHPLWVCPDEVFALLSLVSADLDARVQEFNLARLEVVRQEDVLGRIQALELEATAPAIEEQADAVVDALQAEWDRVRETVRRRLRGGCPAIEHRFRAQRPTRGPPSRVAPSVACRRPQ